MSSIDTSYSLTRGSASSKLQKQNNDVLKYLDIDSTYRNRNLYPNSNNFIIPVNYPGRTSNSNSSIDPVSIGVPYTGSELPVGSNITRTSTINTVQLDSHEPLIDNYYINEILQLSQFPSLFFTITNYDGTLQIATVSPDFPSNPTTGQVYFTRGAQPFFQGSVDTSTVTATTSTFALDSTASTVANLYQNSYIYFTSGLNSGISVRISSYDGLTRTVTLVSPLPNIPSNGDTLDLNSFTRDNASTLIYAGNLSNNTQSNYYEIELLWLSVPNQIIGNGYGGRLDAYPYIYLELYNAGNQLANQVMYSNNPNSVNALFKVPVNQYFGDTYFITLKDCKQKQTVQFHPDQDLLFNLKLPSGEIIEFETSDTVSPNSPNPLLQVNSLIGIKKV
jgi:hypothetical protein